MRLFLIIAAFFILVFGGIKKRQVLNLPFGENFKYLKSQKLLSYSTNITCTCSSICCIIQSYYNID